MSIVDKILKKINNDNVIKFSEKDTFKDVKSWAFTGSPSLDYNLGTFGLPQNMIEIAGPSRGGKTTLALSAMANFQKENGGDAVCAILSSENRDNRDYARRIGVDIDNVIIVKITFLEEMYSIAKSIIDISISEFKLEKKEPKFFFIWDSIGGTLSKNEKETLNENIGAMSSKIENNEKIGALKNEKVGVFAKEAKKFAKFMISEMYDKVIHFVMLNHTYDIIGGMVPGKKSGGGQWIEYFPTIRLYVSSIGMDKVNDVEVAQVTRVKVVKNDFGSRKPTDIKILLGEGIILSDEDIDYALEFGIIKKVGARKHEFMNGKLTWSTKKEFYDLFSSKNKIMQLLVTKIRNEMRKDLMKQRYEED